MPSNRARTASVNTARLPLTTDISNPSTPIRVLRDGSWGNEAKLDRSAGNWPSWSRHVKLILRMSTGLDRHLTGNAPEPDADIEPRAHDNWTINDGAVCAFIASRCAPSEQSFIDNCTSALSMWTTLQTRHQLQGPLNQITLIQQAMNIKYSINTPFADTTAAIRSINSRIWDMGAPTAQEFCVLLMLLALSSPNLRSVRDSVVNGLASASTNAPYTADNIVARLDLEQQVLASENSQTTTPGDAFAARSDTSRLPLVCINCNKPGHHFDFCVRRGGGMAGKSVEEAQTAARERWENNKTKKDDMTPANTSSPDTVYRDAKNRAYTLERVFVNESAPLPTAENIANAMTMDDHAEYAGVAWLNMD